MNRLTAQIKAREFLSSRKVEAFPVDAESLANSLDFHISYKDLPAGESGFSTTIKGKKIICVNSNDKIKRQRFTILHEIGHDYLKLPSKHGESATEAIIGSYAKRPAEEIACDLFAAECLVPWKLLQPFVDEETYSIDVIDYLSDEFNASTPCVASRFADQSQDLLAYVLIEGQKIVYAARSKPLKDLNYWIQLGANLPKGTAAYALTSNNSTAAEAEYGAYIWSSSDVANAYHCVEEAFTLSTWSQTVSLLTFEKATKTVESEDYDSDYESELLPELTGYPEWKKR